jgi:hypothetical protein
LACPFFVPLEILNDGSWPHPSRLPLGAGWTGNCLASGQELAASDTHIREFCNLGYATACPHLPPRRDWDAIRFSVARAGREQVTLCFVCELDHAPIEHGELTFDLASEVWVNPHADARVHRLAICYLEAYRGPNMGDDAQTSGAKEAAEQLVPDRAVPPQRLKPDSKQSSYRSAEALRHPKSRVEFERR